MNCLLAVGVLVGLFVVVGAVGWFVLWPLLKLGFSEED